MLPKRTKAGIIADTMQPDDRCRHLQKGNAYGGNKE